MAIDTNSSASGMRAKRLRLFIVAAILAFMYIPSRLFVLYFVKPLGTDTDLYARYVFIHRIAMERKASFHELYRDSGFAEMARPGPKKFDSLILTVVAYPPFAVAAMNVPALFMKGGCADLETFTERYRGKYRWFCAAVEMAGVIAACFLILTLYGNEKILTLFFRMSVLCLAGLTMPRILYDRLDVLLGAFLILSLALLVRKAVLPSFLVFAFAVNFKLIPVFLLPVLVLGSFLVTDSGAGPLRARIMRMGRMTVTRGAALCLLTVCIALFFYAIEGKGVFDYLKFHLDRGIHIESIWGAFSLLAACLSGSPVHITWAYGAYNVFTPATPVLAALSLPVMAILLTAATAALSFRFVRMDRQAAVTSGAQKIIEAALLFLCIVFASSRIFSPQYLITLVPLVALMPYTGRGAFALSCIFIGVCFLSTLIYPYFYTKAILHGPYGFGLFLLTARMVLLAGIAGLLFVRQFGREKTNRH
jgi:hypothetical protein